MTRSTVMLLLPVALAAATVPEFGRAFDLYQRTEYQQSLKVLTAIAHKDSDAFMLMGQDDYMLGDYKKATEALEKALALGKNASNLYLWLGRAYGRRAQMASPFTAPNYASHARRMFEKAVEVDISNRDAVGDLLEYYMGAPGFLGGGLNKAEDLAHRIEAVDPAESHYLLAQIEDKRKHYDAAEQQLRRALELGPKQVNRILDLAKYLAKHGRTKESDTLFTEAANIAPKDPHVLYYRAETYVEGHRNLEDARMLLQEYLSLPLTPDDPTRESAQALLAKIHV